mgnify:CR=1 FL=1
MPLLSRKRGWKKSNTQSDTSSTSSTQKSQPSSQSLEVVLKNANITPSGGIMMLNTFSSPNVFDSLCSLRQQIQNADQAAAIMQGILVLRFPYL